MTINLNSKLIYLKVLAMEAHIFEQVNDLGIDAYLTAIADIFSIMERLHILSSKSVNAVSKQVALFASIAKSLRDRYMHE